MCANDVSVWMEEVYEGASESIETDRIRLVLRTTHVKTCGLIAHDDNAHVFTTEWIQHEESGSSSSSESYQFFAWCAWEIHSRRRALICDLWNYRTRRYLGLQGTSV